LFQPIDHGHPRSANRAPGGFIDRKLSDGYPLAMSTHTVAETKNQLSKLIDRALNGEHIVVTRRGQPVIEFKPVQRNEQQQEKPTPRWTVEEQLEWLRARRALLPRSKVDAETFVRQMRDEEWER
jgi:antitoxin (DNA-binding transcriptional repressor) of toxin-antitoxin stability system